MEILQEGVLPGEREHTASCTRCGCMVKFKQKEAEAHRGYGDEATYSVKCPTEGCVYKITAYE